MITTIILTVLFILGDAGVLFLSQESFGKLPQGKRLERIKKSPHYDGKQFVNDEETEFMTGNKSTLTVWREFMFNKKKNTVPDTAIHAIKTDLRKLPNDKDWIVWFGHSSYLVNLSGKKILVDPVFYKGSPVKFANKMFKGTDIYKPADMPDIDYLVITHDHWDHLDYETVTELEPRVKKVITALGVGSNLEYWHYPVSKLIELDWWENAQLGDSTRITATPARHFSGRDLHKHKTFWASFVYESPKRTIWIGGDGGYGSHYSKIKANFPNIDLGILENGQYNPDWAQVHTMPQYLGREMLELGAKRYLTVHHSKFCLSKHPYYEPLENAKKAAQESGKPLLMPLIGEVIYLD